MLKDYYITFNQNLDLNKRIQPVAGIISKVNNQPILFIVMENENITRVLPELECGLTLTKNGCFVQITKRYFDEWAIAKPLLFECAMMHELGHYLHNDLQHGYGSAIQQNRHHEDIINNRVTIEEFEADKFALTQTSKSTYMNSLDYLSKYLAKRPSIPEEAAIAQKEIQIRKKALQKLK